jgi:hypothetical protein
LQYAAPRQRLAVDHLGGADTDGMARRTRKFKSGPALRASRFHQIGEGQSVAGQWRLFLQSVGGYL